MQTIEIKGWIFAKPNGYTKRIEFEFSSYDYEKAVKEGYNVSDWGSLKKIAEHTITVDVPDDIDPAALLIAGLEAERTKLRAEFTRRINDINDKIQSLQAIEYKPAEVAA